MRSTRRAAARGNVAHRGRAGGALNAAACDERVLRRPRRRALEEPTRTAIAGGGRAVAKHGRGSGVRTGGARRSNAHLGLRGGGPGEAVVQ
eukprot:6062122-Lingulodinium_polyedra.AAC.1